MVDHRKRLTTNIVFLLSSLRAVLSMAVHIFIALLLHLKTQQEFLTAQATLKRNEFACTTKLKRIAVKKAWALLSCPRWASQTIYTRKSCLAYPCYPTCRGETICLPELSRPPELSHPPHVNGWYNFLNNWVEKYLPQLHETYKQALTQLLTNIRLSFHQLTFIPKHK